MDTATDECALLESAIVQLADRGASRQRQLRELRKHWPPALRGLPSKVIAYAGKVIEDMGSKAAQAHPDFVRAFLSSLPAKQRLAGLAPEQRLAGLGYGEIAEILSALPRQARRQIVARLEGRPPPRARRTFARRAQRKRAAR